MQDSQQWPPAGQSSSLAGSLPTLISNFNNNQALGLLAAIMDHTPVLMSYLDMQFRYVLLSQALLKMLGQPASQLIGQTPFARRPQLEKQLRPLFEKVLQTGQPYVARALLVPYSGLNPSEAQTLYWDVSYTPVLDQNNQPLGILSITEDVTEQVLQSKKLTELAEAERQKAAQLTAVLHSLNDGLAVLNNDGTIILANQMAEQIMGRPLAGSNLHNENPEVLQRRYLDGQSMPTEDGPVARVLRGEVLKDFRYIVKDAQARDIVLSCNGGPVYDDHQQVEGRVILFSDVTHQQEQRHRLEEAQRTAEDTQEALLELSAAIAGITDLQELLNRIVQIMPVVSGCDRLGITLYNPETEEVVPMAVYGIPEENVVQWKKEIGKRDRNSPFDKQLYEDHRLLEFDFAQFVEEMRGQGVEIPNPYNIKNLLALPLAHQGEFLGMITLDHAARYHTFTPRELRVLEGMARLVAIAIANVRLLQQVNEAVVLREANLLKDQFMSQVAHELGNPLTAIKGYTQVLQRQLEKSGASESQLRALSTINEQARRMTRLVEDLLDSARIESGRLELRQTPTNLVELSQRILETYRPSAPNHSFSFELASGSDPALYTGNYDPDRLGQVISNLVSNAIKYSPNGGEIKLRLSRETLAASAAPGQTEPTAPVLHLTVSDQGIGIPLDQQQQLFDRFFRASNTVTNRLPGLGLGLHISRQIIGLQGGQIWLESAGENQGSTFHVVLPVDK